MNYKMVWKYLGLLVLAEALFLLPSALTAVIYREPDMLLAYAITIACCFALGTVLYYFCRESSQIIYAREGFVIAGSGWILVSLLGALPFFLSGYIPNYLHAFFESVSGFTTTGASVLIDVEALPKSLLFWRSFTHWLGGIGVLAFILAAVRTKSGAGFTLHLLRAESPGPQVDKLMPKVHSSVRSLFFIYLILSALNLLLLLAGGMPLFDALCTMFGTAGTGGVGIKNDSMASYSVYLQTVTTVFMALFGINFTIYFFLAMRQWKATLKDEELRLYIGIIIASIAIVTGALIIDGFSGFTGSLHHSAFAVSSAITTTGFSTLHYTQWPHLTRTVLMILMIIGAMGGSTGGGFKIGRILILFKTVKIGLHRLLHPRSVKTVHINGKPLDKDVMDRTLLFLAVYCALIILALLLVSIDGLPLDTNLSAVLSCFNNIGPGLGLAGPAGSYAVYSGFSMFVLTVTMLLGRLEIFPILFLFLPSTFKRKG
ncbi:MAG: TrkH family potassium uptake protein [Christensenellales bacterium]